MDRKNKFVVDSYRYCLYTLLNFLGTRLGDAWQRRKTEYDFI